MTDTPAARGKLYVVGTPIGNLDDLSPRAREVLAKADVIAAEDTRRTRGLLSRIGVEARLIAYHEHNEEQRVAELLERLAAGASDRARERRRHAADQRSRLAPRDAPRARRASTWCRCRGRMPRSSRFSAAGLPTDRFIFEGFLPRREARARSACVSSRIERRTLVFYEAVHRVAETVAALAQRSAPDRRAAIARELTKIHEQIEQRHAWPSSARSSTPSIPLLGEFVIVVAGDTAEPPRTKPARNHARCAVEPSRLCTHRATAPAQGALQARPR